MQLRAAASGLLLALLAGQTVAASFDCSKASSFPEKEICRDGYLSGLDDWLAKSYRCGFHDTWTLSPRSFGHSFHAHLDT